jgi:hypothetical protein
MDYTIIALESHINDRHWVPTTFTTCDVLGTTTANTEDEAIEIIKKQLKDKGTPFRGSVIVVPCKIETIKVRYM